MPYQWLDMRITEERDRRIRLAELHRRLPVAFDELYADLAACVEAYKEAFGSDAAAIARQGAGARIVVREEHEGEWRDCSSVEVFADASIPGFRVERPGGSYLIEIGLLPGEKYTYRDRDADQYLVTEEVTRRILDRALFPKLGD